MKKSVHTILLLLGMAVLTSCTTTKKMSYFQNLDKVDLTQPTSLYDAKLMPKDIIYIYVHTVTPEAAETFNLKGEGSYLVDNDGNIDFPVIGTIHLGGLTTKEGEALIKSKIAPYIAESEKPIVQIRMPNYKYVVLGAVNAPGVYTAPNEKIGVIEALAKAGDIKFSGKRDKVSLIRERADGSREVHQMDVTDANILNSPYYYLQQNDIVYVEPKKTHTMYEVFTNYTSMWFSLLSMVTTISTFIIALKK
jgi:polysaccharide export outer membrane protein